MKKLLTAVTAMLISVGFGEVKDVTVEQAVTKMKKDPKIVVVDIRTPEEYATGHIKGAINIDMLGKDFAEKLGKLDKDKTYLMHCKSGGRSTASIKVWDQLKFKNVLHLKAGMLGWTGAKQMVVVPKTSKNSE